MNWTEDFKATMEAFGITQTALAEELGIASPCVSAALQSGNTPRKNTKQRYEDALERLTGERVAGQTKTEGITIRFSGGELENVKAFSLDGDVLTVQLYI